MKERKSSVSKPVIFEGKAYPSLSELWRTLKKANRKNLPAKSSFIRRAKDMPLKEAVDKTIPFQIKSGLPIANIRNFARALSEDQVQNNIARIVAREKRKPERKFEEQSIEEIFKELQGR